MPFRERKSERVRQPLVEIVLSILNYLITHPKERLVGGDPDWIGASRYEIRLHLQGTQHDAIVGDALDRLFQLGYVKPISATGPATYYRITEDGRNFYTSRGIEFLNFAKKVRKGRVE